MTKLWLGVGLPGGTDNGAAAVAPPGFYDIQMATGATSIGPTGATNTDPVAAGWISQSSTTTRYFPDATGAYQSYASGTISQNSAGIWNRGVTRRNIIRNNSMTGAVNGAPGTLPTGATPIGWSQLAGVPSGITLTTTWGTDTTLNLPCVDLNFAGTAGAGATYELQFHGNAAMGGCHELKTAAPSVAGTGYVVGDTITLASTGGTAQVASILTVTTIGASGAVTGVSITEPGMFTVEPTSNPMAQASTSGVGVNATFTVTYGLSSFVGSCWMALTGGSLLRNDNACLQLSFTTTGGTNAGTKFTSKRLLNRETTLVRKKVQALPSLTTAANPKLEFQFTFTNGGVYNTTIRLICPQMERTSTLYEDASWPIMTTNANVQHAATTTSILAGPLGYVTGGTCTLQLGTNHLSTADYMVNSTRSMITVNGTTNAMYMDTFGQIASSVLAGITTYRVWRSQHDWVQTHAVQWGAGTAKCASTANAQISPTASGSLPSITSAAITADGCATRLRVYQTQIDLSSYLSVNKDHVIYGATSDGVIRAAQTIASGKTAAIAMRWREVQPGGMSTGGLSRIDASSLANFGGMAIDMLYYAGELAGSAGSPTSTADPIQKWTLDYFDYLIRTYQIPMMHTRPANSTPGGISSVSKNNSSKRIISFTTAANQVFTGTYFSDSSYEGDLMAGASCTFTTGRELADTSTDANGLQKNPANGNRGTQPGTSATFGLTGHQFIPTRGSPVPADELEVYPWDGLPSTTRVSQVQADNTTSIGAADPNSCMAYNFRQTLTATAANFVAFPAGAPSGYNVKTYEMLGRYNKALLDAGNTVVSRATTLTSSTFSLGSFMTFNGYGGNIYYDMNNLNGFSSDAIGTNWGADFQTITGSSAQQYIMASNAERATYWNWLKNYTLGLWYYLQIDAPLEQAALTVAVNAGGSGYAVNDYVSCAMANQSYPLVVRVTTISGGAITGFQICSGSIIAGQANPSNPISQSSTSGSGTGATFNVSSWGARVPSQVTTDALTFGVTNDNFQTTYCEEDFIGWMPEMYTREGRRLIGTYKVNSSDVNVTIGATPLQGTNTCAAGSYPIDSHHVRRMAYNSSGVWRALNEGNLQISRVGLNTYFLIPFESVVPLQADCSNLVDGFSGSATHPAFGGIRMEMAIMAVGQFAGIMVATLLNNGSPDVQSFAPYYSTARTTGLAAGLVLPQTN